MENSMMTWLFNYAPLTALTIFLTWAVWRFGALSGKYEARFTGIETDIRELKTELKEVKSGIGEMKEKMAEMKQENRHQARSFRGATRTVSTPVEREESNLAPNYNPHQCSREAHHNACDYI
jgi:hypothetical protein